MAQKPRLYLFYGPDSWSSSRAVDRWKRAFLDKFGETTFYSINCDDVPLDHCLEHVQTALQGQNLFAEPRLLMLRRLTSQENGRSRVYSQAVISQILAAEATFDDSLTIVIWVDQGLDKKHPLLIQFSKWAEEGVGKVTLFPIFTAQRMIAAARHYVSESGYSLSTDAERWLNNEYGRLGKQLRIEQRLKYGQEPLQDYRSWWMYQTLDSALVLSDTQEIDEQHLKAAVATTSEPIAVFDIVNAITTKQWTKSSQLLQGFERTGATTSDYLGLLAALRWQLTRPGTRFTPQEVRSALQLLMNLEIISKNFSFELPWLFDLFLLRLQKLNQEFPVIINPRKLWLAHIARS